MQPETESPLSMVSRIAGLAIIVFLIHTVNVGVKACKWHCKYCFQDNVLLDPVPKKCQGVYCNCDSSFSVDLPWLSIGVLSFFSFVFVSIRLYFFIQWIKSQRQLEKYSQPTCNGDPVKLGRLDNLSPEITTVPQSLGLGPSDVLSAESHSTNTRSTTTISTTC